MTSLFSRIAFALMSLLFIFSVAPSHAANYYNPQEIEQLVAPVALYPDPLLSQVLMAATYPVEVVEAARWRAEQPERLSDQQLARMMQDQQWDPSVKSLAAFPDVLNMMDENISWTDQLGEAFLNQEEDVMDAVQRLRARAQAAGNLQSGPQQIVSASSDSDIITIMPAQPDIVYVPIYNPTVIYGAWPYPNNQPYYWHPPRYVVSGPRITFAGALIAGGVLWSTYDWRERRFDINVNRYNRYNRTHITREAWHQNFEHRRIAPRRDSVTRERFDNHRRNNALTPERFNQEGRNRAISNNGRRNPGMDNERRGNESGSSRPNNRTENFIRRPSQREQQARPSTSRTPQRQTAPQFLANPQSRQADRPRAASGSRPAPQFQTAPQSRPVPQSRPMPQQMPRADSRRAQGMERPANVMRSPREARNNNDVRGFGDRGGHGAAARPPAQRQAQAQERRAPRAENPGRREKDRD